MARKTLGQILRELNTAIPDAENLPDSEASPWVFVPQRGEDARIRLDELQDLKSDAEVTSSKAVISRYASSLISENRRNDNSEYTAEAFDNSSRRNNPDADAVRNFQRTKRSSLQSENGSFGDRLVRLNSDSLQFGSRSSSSDLPFLRNGTEANTAGQEAVDSKLINSNVYEPNNEYTPLNTRLSTDLDRQMYALKTYEDRGKSVNDNFDRNVAASVENRLTPRKANIAAEQLLQRATSFRDNVSIDAFNREIDDFNAPPIFVVQSINDLSIKYSDQFDSIRKDLNANEDILRSTNHNPLLTSIDRTYGTISNPSQPFDGIPISLITTAFTGVVALLAVANVHQFILKAICTRKNEYSESESLIKALVPGFLLRSKNDLGLNSFLTKDRDPELEFINGLSSTYAYQIQKRLQGDNLYNDFYVGLKLFYGVSELENAGDNVVKNPLKYTGIFNSPGYFATIARRILMDVNVISDIIPSNSQNELSSVTENVASLFGRIVNSFTFAFFTRLVVAGIQNRMGNFYSEDNNSQLAEYEIGDSATPDTQAFQINEAIFNRNRFSKINGVNPLSLQNYRNLFLLSKTSINLKNKFSLVGVSADSLEDGQYNLNAQWINRFPKELVEMIEKTIDCDYVPFSIQDVRTNEIISLPAFIESVSDSFSPSYETTYGFGRTDPIYSYNKTDRSINMNFNLISFNAEDHDRLYQIINRLVSMCYPQYTRGEERKFNDKQFIQPFSQLQAASPLIRLRLGDLVSSNKSLYALKSLFGVDKKISLDEIKNTKSIFQSKNMLRRGEKPEIESVILNPGIVLYDDTVATRPIKLKKQTKATISRVEKNKAYLELDPVFNELIKITDMDFTEYYFDTNKDWNKVEFLGKSTNVDNSNTGFSAAAANDQTEARASAQFSDEDFSSENNPVVRAFDSTHGKGLAGFITSLNLEYENKNWGITLNDDIDIVKNPSSRLRAPMHVKIALTFSPIHDMPLGLDYTGRMIAPSHPVGTLNSDIIDSL